MILLFSALQAYTLDLLRNILHENMRTEMLSSEECKSSKISLVLVYSVMCVLPQSMLCWTLDYGLREL